MTCDQVVDNWKFLIKNMMAIYSDLSKWGGHSSYMANFKKAFFAHFKFIELLHPTVAFCAPIDSEMRGYFATLDAIFTSDFRD